MSGSKVKLDAPALISPLPVPDESNATSRHYSKQWGQQSGYTTFIKDNPHAVKHTMARQLGWPELFSRIRVQANERPTSVYDAACGFGSIHRDLYADPSPRFLSYLGADIHNALDTIDNPFDSARFIRFDVSAPPPTDVRFDYVLCRAALHHTPSPERTLQSLASVMGNGATLAISVYTKKAPVREAADDALRQAIVPMTPDEAFGVCRQFSLLGRDLQDSAAVITITEDLPFLGIAAGTYPVQSLIYDHFLKCWYNKDFGLERSDTVNFDWYHPPFAFRYSLCEIVDLVERAGLAIVRTESNQAQHYVEAVRPM